jgi:hypothetical protein
VLLLLFGCLVGRGRLNPASHQFLKRWLDHVAWDFLPLFKNAFLCLSNSARMHIKKNKCEKCFCHLAVRAHTLFFLLTLEGSSHLCAGCVSSIFHSKFHCLFVDSTLPLICVLFPFSFSNVHSIPSTPCVQKSAAKYSPGGNDILAPRA